MVSLLSSYVFADPNPCAPQTELVVEAGTTSVSTIYAHIEGSLNAPPGCAPVPANAPCFSLTITDNDGVTTSFPFTVLDTGRVRFTPTTYGVYTLNGTTFNAYGSTERKVLFRKGPF